MLSDVVICYWSCDFLSSRNLTGLPSFLGFFSLPVCTHRLRQRRRWRSYALGHGGAVSLDDLWSKKGARHSQWRRWTQKKSAEGYCTCANRILNDLTMYLYLFLTSFVPCFGADSKICSNLLKRKQTVSNPVLVVKTFAMLRTPLSFLFQGHCLRQGNFHYASRDAGTTWIHMGRLGFHCRDAQNCSGTHVSVGNDYLQVTMFIIPRNPALRCCAIWPKEVKKLHEMSDDIGMIPWETNLAPNINEIMRMS